MRCARGLGLLLAILVGTASPLLAAIQLIPVATGLASPVLVTHAGDGTRRLFIEEQAGYIRVLQPGSTTPTLFLDIHTKVRFGGEQGLLGLAFHPRYSSNGRFYIYYVRVSDQALIIAQYRVSADPNLADPASEAILLTIPHPSFTNHNGGMLVFGPDGYLYIGVGDGGSANDPGNNAQNVNVLLGKILRIDVDPAGAEGYASPATNPFYGAIAGRDEIYAFGLRNPWRFTFDRERGDAWIADVGQGAREEVDMPLLNGGNYGWRVYEGLSCTNVDPALCRPSSYTSPLFEYNHSGGRCSITGGFVYRGSARALPAGTYVYADYCSGEIFAWDGTAQRLLLDTSSSISSFGEDERGELYVVDLDGTVSLIASDAPCHPALTRAGVAFGPRGGEGTLIGRAAGCSVVVVESNASWIHVSTPAVGPIDASGRFSVEFSVDAYTLPTARVGTIVVGDATFTVQQNGGGGAQAP